MIYSWDITCLGGKIEVIRGIMETEKRIKETKHEKRKSILVFLAWIFIMTCSNTKYMQKTAKLTGTQCMSFHDSNK